MSIKLAYLAGIIDGEGTITLDKHSVQPFRRIVVSVSNTDTGLIEWLKTEFGGGVRLRNGRKSHYKPLYEWRLRDEPALILLRRVRRYLKIKKPRADLICDNWRPVPRTRVYTPAARAAKLALEAAVLSL